MKIIRNNLLLAFLSDSHEGVNFSLLIPLIIFFLKIIPGFGIPPSCV